MHVEPFHSVEFLALRVHHNHPGCEIGNSLRLAHTRGGTGGRQLCSRCAELAAAERRAAVTPS
jgi:hypothetical protein